MKNLIDVREEAKEAAEEIKITLRKLKITREVAVMACRMAGEQIERETRAEHRAIEQREYK